MSPRSYFSGIEVSQHDHGPEIIPASTVYTFNPPPAAGEGRKRESARSRFKVFRDLGWPTNKFSHLPPSYGPLSNRKDLLFTFIMAIGVVLGMAIAVAVILTHRGKSST